VAEPKRTPTLEATPRPVLLIKVSTTNVALVAPTAQFASLLAHPFFLTIIFMARDSWPPSTFHRRRRRRGRNLRVFSVRFRFVLLLADLCMCAFSCSLTVDSFEFVVLSKPVFVGISCVVSQAAICFG
jgi:hypothetical protein